MIVKDFNDTFGEQPNFNLEQLSKPSVKCKKGKKKSAKKKGNLS